MLDFSRRISVQGVNTPQGKGGRRETLHDRLGRLYLGVVQATKSFPIVAERRRYVRVNLYTGKGRQNLLPTRTGTDRRVVIGYQAVSKRMEGGGEGRLSGSHLSG